MNLKDFPRTSDLHDGAILATIAYAIWLMPKPTLSHELSWEASNYNRQDSAGTRGTITFDGKHIVGVFRDDNSLRCPWRSGQEYQITPYLVGMPNDLIELAQKQTLSCVLDEYEEYKGPIITTAFWSNGVYLTAAEEWQAVVTHGAHLLRVETMPISEGLEEWESQFEFSRVQTDLLTSVFEKRITRSGKSITLSDAEYKVLLANGSAGLSESAKLLNAVGIQLFDGET